ncbi:hypothetical protein ACFL6Y_01510 [Elusimicrobiota bacterium]
MIKKTNYKKYLFCAAIFSLMPLRPGSSADLSANNWTVDGEMSANYRGIGRTEAEVEVENQLYVSDIYFSFNKPSETRLPKFIEFTMDLESKPVINQFYLNYAKIEKFFLTLGKSMIPFGRGNEIYKQSDFLSITRPLPYSSPQSLDFIARLNIAQPVMASGFADLGIIATMLPKAEKAYVPSRIDLYVSNGFAENPLRGRGFPRAEGLGEPRQQGGVLADYGHEQTTLADNNDTKMAGGRVRFAIGDLRIPFLPEGIHLNGAQIGFSGFTNKYDVEDRLDQRVFGTDFVFQYDRYSITGEYIIVPMMNYRIARSSSVADRDEQPLPIHNERLRGYYVSTALNLPRWFYGTDTYLFMGISSMMREGEQMATDAWKNYTFIRDTAPRIKRTISKYTIGTRSKIKDFHFKVEYSYWNLSLVTDIYQWAVSSVVRF